MTEWLADPFLDLEGVARRLGVSIRRARSIPPEELPYLQLERRGHRRYRLEDLERYLERRTVRGRT